MEQQNAATAKARLERPVGGKGPASDASDATRDNRCVTTAVGLLRVVLHVVAEILRTFRLAAGQVLEVAADVTELIGDVAGSLGHRAVGLAARRNR